MIDGVQLAEAITNTFIWKYKKGDNIIYNFGILDQLYDSKKSCNTNKKHLFNKPIMLIIISIVECIMDDFAHRVKYRSQDPLPNITSRVIADFKTKKYDKLQHFIAVSKKYNLFEQPQNFYIALDNLRKIRNRFHIQNSSGELEPDDSRVFTEERLTVAQRVLEIIIEKMMTKYPRCDSEVEFKDIVFPWSN